MGSEGLEELCIVGEVYGDHLKAPSPRLMVKSEAC